MSGNGANVFGDQKDKPMGDRVSGAQKAAQDTAVKDRKAKEAAAIVRKSLKESTPAVEETQMSMESAVMARLEEVLAERGCDLQSGQYDRRVRIEGAGGKFRRMSVFVRYEVDA